MPELKEVRAIRQDNYRFLQEHILKESGIVLDDTKHYLVEARLLPVASAEGLSNLDDLCARLRLSPSLALRRRVIEAMTTNETYFFREPAHFDVLRHTIIPSLLARRSASKTISIWSAAASSGQEAYSIAMLLAEMGLSNSPISIVGTDLAETVLEKARRGLYSQLEVNRGLPATLLVKYFTRKGLFWELKPELRNMVRFESLDLRKINHTRGPYDVIFCRNVLIYFDAETKQQIFEQMRMTLASDGFFFLGSSEVGMNIGPAFSKRSTNEATYYQPA